MTYENGKRLAILGFGINLIIEVIYSLLSITSSLLSLNVYTPFKILSLGTLLSIGVVAFGFFVIWMCTQRTIDLVSFVALGASVFFGLLNWLGIINLYSGGILSIIFSVVVSFYFIVLAFRAKQFNTLIFVLLICAFLLNVFSGFVFNRIYNALPYFMALLINNLLYIGFAALCFIEVKSE